MNHAPQKIFRIRRDYNSWVANETLEDYALRYTPQSARKWSELRVANTALGGVSFLALEAIGGAIALTALIHYGPYPIAMIGVPGEPLSNSMPPTLALLALGITQTGLALALEPLGRAMLSRLTAWTATVLVNGMIMTIYLWHLTAFVAVMVAAWLMGGIGLHVAPGSTEWWLARPVWFLLYIVALVPLILAFARFERPSPSLSGDAEDRPLPLWRLATGLLLICAGLGTTAAFSIASPEGVTGVRLWIVALPFLGAALIRFGPAYTLAKRV